MIFGRSHKTKDSYVSFVKAMGDDHVVIEGQDGCARITLHKCWFGTHSGMHIYMYPKDIRKLAVELNKAADEVEGKR